LLIERASIRVPQNQAFHNLTLRRRASRVLGQPVPRRAIAKRNLKFLAWIGLNSAFFEKLDR